MKKINRTAKGYILAEGETTGHAHRTTDDIELFQDGDVKKMKMENSITVTHEEHDAQVITPPKKDYVTIDTVRELNHVENTIEKVKD